MTHIFDIDFLEFGGVKIGHAQNEKAGTGVTVFIFEKSVPCSCDVRGGGPASRETQLLSPFASCAGVDAILLSGGSAFSLGAANGVQKFLLERNRGFQTPFSKVPLVVQSALYDLGVADSKIFPDAKMAYHACENAQNHAKLEWGNVGAGTGCSVGKYLGINFAMKSGIGFKAVRCGKIKFLAVAAVNAFGDIFDFDGKKIAGFLDSEKKSFLDTIDLMAKDCERKSLRENLFLDLEKSKKNRKLENQTELKKSDFGLENSLENLATENLATNTTLAVIMTNGKFEKMQLAKIARDSHNGFARAISPVHTTADGDTIYAVSLGEEKCSLDFGTVLASYVVQHAVVNAVKSAKSAYGLKSFWNFAKNVDFALE